MSPSRHLACESVLCVGCPTHRRHTDESVCLAAHSEREGWGRYFWLLLTLFPGSLQQRDAVWLSEASQCKCFLSQAISVLPFETAGVALAAGVQLVPGRALETSLSEDPRPCLLPSRTSRRYQSAVVLTNCCPERGLLHPAGQKNRVRRAGTFVGAE